MTDLPHAPRETTIQELFDMDPLKLSDRDFDRIIEEARKDRARYMAGEKAVTKAAATKAAKGPKGDQTALADLLGELDL